MINISVSLADATVTGKETLTAGRVGLQCQLSFSADWDDLQKIVVCEGAETREVPLTGDTITVPPECMATAGYRLRIGVMGISATEEIVIPTVWAKVGKILESADVGGDIYPEATPSVVAQIMENSATALELAQNVANAAANGDFNGAPGADGANATIVGATGSVDDQVGTPSVEVTVGGSDTERTFDFAFHNMKGEKGDKGDTGNTGPTPAFSVGTVTTGAAGSSAAATITGTTEAPVLNLTIPKGDKGDKGDTGNTGATPAFSVGTVTTGAAGSSAAATISGTAAAPVLNLTIPQGLKGDAGNGDMVADDFSTSNAYAVGDYVIYSGSLYRFTTAHAAGAWSASDVTAVQLAEDVSELKSALETFEDGFGNLNLWYKAELLYTDRYADISGTTGKIIYRENAYGIGTWLLEVDGTKTYTSSQSMRTLVPLQGDKETPTANAALSYVYSIDLTNYPNTKYLAISLEEITSTVISEGATAQSGTVYPAWLHEFNHGKRPSYNATYSGITSGSSVGLPVSNCLRKNSRLMFVAEIASYGQLEIGYATGANGTGDKYNRFLIGPNGIVAYTYYDYAQSAMHQETAVQHGLAISAGNVEVVVEELPDGKCKLTIGNNGNSFTHTFDGWVRNNRLSPYVTANWSVFGKSFFSWTCTDLNKDIWLLGDSYMAYEPERWAYYLEQNGYADNVLISSFPGAWSSTNVASFEMLLKYGTPKYAVWGMGMNDGGDSANAPSNSWVAGRDNFLALCEDNHITPIFCTIPTVPTVNNEQKNAWIRASGYRYIDFAKAVLATSSGAWGTGMLSGDGVHPTANGAKALYYQVLTDFPEIMVA